MECWSIGIKRDSVPFHYTSTPSLQYSGTDMQKPNADQLVSDLALKPRCSIVE
jgi:predicted methyltransferase